jgi:ketosteroid isomerase-like protein
VLRSVIPVMLVVLGANSASAQESSDSVAAVHSIRKALADWVAAANRGDWKTAAQVWAPDLIGWYPGQPDDTYQLEMARLANPKPGAARTHYDVNVVEVMVSGRLAVVRDIWRFTTPAGSSDSTVTIVRGYEVWRRQPDQQWKISRWISAPEPSPSR